MNMDFDFIPYEYEFEYIDCVTTYWYDNQS